MNLLFCKLWLRNSRILKCSWKRVDWNVCGIVAFCVWIGITLKVSFLSLQKQTILIFYHWLSCSVATRPDSSASVPILVTYNSVGKGPCPDFSLRWQPWWVARWTMEPRQRGCWFAPISTAKHPLLFFISSAPITRVIKIVIIISILIVINYVSYNPLGLDSSKRKNVPPYPN